MLNSSHAARSGRTSRPVKGPAGDKRSSRPMHRLERGAFTLASLMLLLLLMGMTTLLGARLMLGDQMGSEALVQGQQRQSLQESALDWGLALLNGSVPDADCTPLDHDTAPGWPATPFPDRLTRTDEQGRRHVLPAWQATPLRCHIEDGAWHCRCPVVATSPAIAGVSSLAGASPAISGTSTRLAPSDGTAPAWPRLSTASPTRSARLFPMKAETRTESRTEAGTEAGTDAVTDARTRTEARTASEADGTFTDQFARLSLEFQGLERPDAATWRRRTLQMLGRACAQGQALCQLPGTPASSPLPESGQVQLLAMASSLTQAPGSAVVASGPVDLRGLASTQAGIALPPDAHTAWAVQSGAAILGATGGRLQGPPGSTAGSLQRAHAADLAGPPPDFFSLHFGLPPADYAAHPALSVLECHDAPDCAPALAEKLRSGRTWLWIKGPLRLRSALDIGSRTQPALLICDADVDIEAPVRLTGLLYSHGRARLGAAGDPLRIEGALLSAGPSTLIGHVQVLHSPAVLRRLADLRGSWVRLPGGWRS